MTGDPIPHSWPRTYISPEERAGWCLWQDVEAISIPAVENAIDEDWALMLFKLWGTVSQTMPDWRNILNPYPKTGNAHMKPYVYRKENTGEIRRA